MSGACICGITMTYGGYVSGHTAILSIRKQNPDKVTLVLGCSKICVILTIAVILECSWLNEHLFLGNWQEFCLPEFLSSSSYQTEGKIHSKHGHCMVFGGHGCLLPAVTSFYQSG